MSKYGSVIDKSAETFHTKCLSVTKAMLDTVNNSPNIHWYCHDCNDGNRHISTSLKNIDDSIARLTTSLSGELVKFLDGLKSLMDNILGKFVTMCSASNNNHSAVSLDATDQLKDGNLFAAPVRNSNVAAPKIITDSSTVATQGEKVKSIVVSNISKDVSMDCLRK